MKKSLRTAVLSTVGITALAGLFLAPETLLVASDETQNADPVTTVLVDGKTSETAAASCWEIKQNDPDSESGAYWLYTPQMSAPQQFYCDQETDGGGWVMVGRGREGWTEKSTGQGNPSDIALTPTGSAAFTPAQLSSDTVNALLNGKTISESIPQGIRLHRALVNSGSEWQDVTFNRQNNSQWSWTFDATTPWDNITFTDNRWYGTTTKSLSLSLGQPTIGDDNTFYTVNFAGMASQGWQQGFAYGSNVYGKNDASSYIWSKNNGGNGIPFTQVFIRPKITQNDLVFADNAATGVAASNRRALPNSLAEKVTWRTSEQTATGNTGELNAYVQAITQVGNTVFVGGDYAYVENAATGERVNQQYLTGYNVDTGELVRTFMPKFNNQIKALEALPNGLLAVGGEFTQVNGESANGLVLLNPVTGKVDTRWGWQIENRLSGGSPVAVRSLDASNGYLYVAGSFTHSKAKGNKGFVYARNAMRFKLSDGTADTTWTPSFNGSVNGINASDDGQAVYLAGYFNKLLSKNKDTNRLAALRTDNADTVADWTWEPSYKGDTRPNAGFQFDVQDAGETVYAGGSEHLIAQYDRYTFARVSSSITFNGGDFQDLYRDGDTIYGACHCGDWNYQGSGSHYSTPWQGATQIDSIKLVGAYDRATGEYLDEFQPYLQGASGFGVWESFVDSNGVLWVGGDINTSDGFNGRQKTVGFARFAPRDVTPPATPSGLTIDNQDGKDVLSWSAVAEQNVKYQIIRNNRVIATTDKPTYSTKHEAEANYFVRAVDASGNYSASTAAVVAVEVAPDETNTATASETAEPTASAEATVTSEPTESAEASASAEPSASTEPTETATTDASEEPSAEASPSAEGTTEVTEEAVIEPTVETAQKVVVSGDTWSYRVADSSAGRTWNTLNAVATGWKTGTTPMGWGSFGNGTTIDRGRYMPVAFYARKEIDIKDPAQARTLNISTYADDGIVVYINGKEVARRYVTTNRLSYSSLADWWVDTSEAKTKPLNIEVPASSLSAGKNVIAVEVHGAWRSSTNVSFDLSATLNS